MAEKTFKGFELIKESNFNSLASPDKQKIYFVRTSTGDTKDDGFIYFNGKKYGTGKLSSDKIQTQLTALQNEVNNHITNKASVTATERTSGTTDNGALSGDTGDKWLTGTAIAEIKKYVDSEDVKKMVLTGNKIQLQNKSNAVLAELDAKSFIKDGMLQSVTLTTGTTEGKVLRFTWNTDGEKTDTDIEVSEFFHEISGDTNTITVTQPESGTTGILQISAKTVANFLDVTSGSTELITAGATALYVLKELTSARNEMTKTISLSSRKNDVTYASAEIAQFYGTIQQANSDLVLNVATGLTTEHAGFVYNSLAHTFKVNVSDFTKQGLLDAQEVITLLRNNNKNIADALTYLKGQITALSDNMTTVTGSDYIRVDKALDTNNYRVSASGTLQTAIDNANKAVKSVNGKSGTGVTINTDDIKPNQKPDGYPQEDWNRNTTVTDVLNNIYSKLSKTSSDALTKVVGSDSINVTAKESGSQTISVKRKTITPEEKGNGYIQIEETADGIYGLLYFGGDDVEDNIATEM